ncbi:hypothetical protein B0H63DRAFT_456392 [Podospora didyma]|uniref:Uncharacterized protein n=1 Tax=Podospora didyma TaxID=330526 RepID=A0AAE0P465_9PEZI|nr:hypothetical protein B0H63DRAFT_456392 [Podospora didyma]
MFSTRILAVLATMALGALASPVNTTASNAAIDKCSLVRCASGTTCVVIANRAVCIPIPKGEQCGTKVCPYGLTCCNASCGKCVEPGMMCTQEACLPLALTVPAPVAPTAINPLPPRKQCGPTLCAVGDVCCNSSCGICTKPGGFCTQQFCEPKPPLSGDGIICGATVCAAGKVCCNASCGICTDPEAACTQQVCSSSAKLG